MPEASHPNPSDAFVLALTESQTALRGYCQAALGHGEEAKEALQRTSIVLFKKAADWDPDTDFIRWAISVAKFEVLGVIRDRQRERRRYVFDSDVVEQMVDEAAISVTSQDHRSDALEFCLGKLSSKNRNFLSAYYAQGSSLKEIATASNRGLSAVKVMLLRLRRRLGECIEGQLAKEKPA
ncbi:MAG: sigma-70 family RNA polymerase sigma factor [Verrucomicrobiota bacterium]